MAENEGIIICIVPPTTTQLKFNLIERIRDHEKQKIKKLILDNSFASHTFNNNLAINLCYCIKNRLCCI